MARQDGKAWNPYLAGGLSGVLIILSVALTDKFLGASTTFVRSSGMIEQVFSPERVAKMAYFLKEKPIIDWQWMFVLGIFLGSLISSLTSGSFQWQAVPDSWRERFGAAAGKRWATAFAGGVVAMFGARLADG
jgi:uncharacterized protein